jgi:gliding motility-associated-like protein
MSIVNVPVISLIANAGPDQAFCGNSTDMAANASPDGIGTWSLISGAGIIASVNSPTSNITGLGIGVNTFEWRITNACDTISDTMSITITDNSTLPNAGIDQFTCSTLANLNANVPSVGIGSWSLVSGSGIITTPSDPNTGITGMAVGENIFVWTISNICSSATDTVSITVESAPTIPNAGPDQNVCGPLVTMAANIPLSGNGIWTLFSGAGTIVTPNSPSSSITGLNVGSNVFVWTISNSCGTNSDTVIIISEITPTTAIAGPDQTICSLNTTLDGNFVAIGTGIWTLFSGAGIITTPTDSLTTITGLGVGINQFVWTISNVCSTTSDTVSITLETIPTIPDAGPDQFSCTTTGDLAGNMPLIGSGLWTLFGGTGNITTPNSPSSALTGMSLGDNTFVWTISNTCGSNSDNVIITMVNSPTISNAGPDQFTCLSNATLAGNPSIIGVGTWSLISGSGTITTPSDSLSTVTGLGIGANVFAWTINSLCGISTDQVTITVETPPTQANAGIDDSICGTNTNLAGNLPISGSGVWSLVSGAGAITTPSIPTSGVTNLGFGLNLFEWRITNTCGTTADTVIIISETQTIQAICGPDTTFCGPNGTIYGNDYELGSGLWTLTSPQGTISITSPTDSISGVTGLTVGVHIFRWTITNVCGSTFDEYNIRIEGAPTIANAGPNQVAVCSDNSNLAASPALVGIGVWSLISGAGTIVSPNLETSAVTNLGLGPNVFQWTVSNTCNQTSDQVTLIRFDPPTTPLAGIDSALCGTTATLRGNTALIGNGIWTLVSGTGTIANSSNAVTTVSNLGVGANVFQWTISNGCGNPNDRVTINVDSPPTVAKAGIDTIICGGTAMLDGNEPNIGNGIWTLISGSGSINTLSDSTSGVNNLGTGDNIFEWTISNTCGTSSAQMIINNRGQCPDPDSLKDELYFYVPNSFTPNDDDFNSTFQPIFTSGYEPQEFTLYIFDRWGEIIFESHDADKGWKGRYGVDGVMVQDGAYTWKIIFTDIKEQKEHVVVGHVIMIR